jgi:hexulose-6-phosphate isomerase
MNLENKLGFIQGRLSPMYDGMIQAFPWNHWQDEFIQSSKLNLSHIEWTLDYDRLYENPFLTKDGQEEIKALVKETGVQIPSLTGDFFMQKPFYKAQGEEREHLLKVYIDVLNACDALNVKYVVIPLVDNGSITSDEMEKDVIESLVKVQNTHNHKVQVVFESDYPASKLAGFIEKFPKSFGINYDTGNSAALGYKPADEIPAYGSRIYNIHLKDRILNDTTVRFGTGDTDFKSFFDELKSFNYEGNFIFQSARAADESHAEELQLNIDFIRNIIK